jgi:mono/diheme cytochrome c family protein
MTIRILIIALAWLTPVLGWAAPPTLTLTVGGRTLRFTAAALLGRPDARDIAIPLDASYGHPERYRAVKLLDLLAGMPADPADTFEMRATGGFVSQVPAALVRRGAQGGSVAWLAVEDPAHPWPHLDGKDQSAGPFYLVWEHPERSGVSPEQWPYALASIVSVASPVQRWPQLALPASVSAGDPARRGLAVFVTQCLPCHKLRGAGAGEVGPDLGQPMPAVAYFTDAGLRALLRDPKQVRTWPQQQMPGADRTSLPDADIDAVLAYLHAAAGRG